jgi:hypothetical protein
MQIHELTKKQPLTEAGLGDYLKAALSTDPTIVAMHNNPNVSLAQRAKAIATNKKIDQIAKKAYDSWNQNYLQLVKSNGNQPLSAAEYADELEAFVQKNLMPAYTPLAGVSNAPQIKQAIQTATANANNPKAQAGAFNQLVDLAAVARELSQSQQQARALGQAAQAATTGGQPAVVPQLPAAPATNYNVPAYQRKQQAFAQTRQEVIDALPSYSDKRLMQLWTKISDAPMTSPDVAKDPFYIAVQDQVQQRGLIGGDTSQSQASAANEPLTVGGQKLDPTNPADAKIIQQLQAQGKLPGNEPEPAATTPAPESPPEIERLKTNVVNQITGQNKLSTKDAAGRVDALLKKGTFSPRDVQAWARSLPPGNIPTKPYPPGEYPAVNMMVNKLLGLA